MERIRVALVDDHTLFRQGTRQLLERGDGVEVIWEAGDGREALDLVAEIEPDVLIVDVEMPELDGIEVTRQVKLRHPAVRVLVLTMHDEEPLVFAVLEHGADGYLLKDVDSRELTDAVRRIRSGESVLHPAIARQVLTRVRADGNGEPPPGQQISPGDQEVLLLAARGLTNREIADALKVSPRTVQQRLTRVFERFGVGSRTEAAIRGLQEGVISLEDL